MNELYRPSWVKKLPKETQETVAEALEAYATEAYIGFFYRPNHTIPDWKWIDGIKDALQMSDEVAVERLYEIADEFPYSSPTDEHPAFDFSMDGLNMVSWPEVLRRLRLEAENA